jgi:endonuclease YncB( thermonuclease family)
MNTRAVVDRVIDGDTLWVRLRVRLAKSAPEPGTPEGDAATERARRALWKGRRVQIVTHSVDDYGRIIGHLVDDDFNDGSVEAE